MPINFSFFAYNETVAQEYFPLKKEEVLAQGWKWRDSNSKQYQPQTYDIPDNIQDAQEEITKALLACRTCGKNYKIIPQELQFYRQMQLPIPRQCPNCRHMDRLQRRAPYKLWLRNCSQCGKSIPAVYAPGRPEKVYCEECYLETVY